MPTLGGNYTIGDYLTACTYTLNGLTPEIEREIVERIYSGDYLMIKKEKLSKLQEAAGKFEVIKDLFKE